MSLISWKRLFRKTLPVRLLCAFILCQRERKRHWIVRRAQPCVLHFRAEDHFILGGRCPRVSRYLSDCVKGEICFKKIVSNTRLDLNCSSFHAFGLWVFNYLQIYIYIYSVFVYCFCLSILFVLLFIVKSAFCSFCIITKLNCCNISNNLKADLIHNIAFTTIVLKISYNDFWSGLEGGNTKEWWVDTRATRHVYSEKKMFSTYNPVGNRRKIFMGNSSTSKFEGIEKVVLKMTTGRFLTLKDVSHALEIQKNLVSGLLSSKNCFKFLSLINSL